MDIIIPIDELKAFLKLIGVTTEFTDTELELIIKLLTDYLNSRLGGLIYGYNTTDIFNHNCSNITYRCGEELLLNQFPIHHIININLQKEVYFIHESSGVLEFLKDTNINGFLKVTYRVGLSDDEIKTIIVPLFFDLIRAYFNPTGEAVSLTEGEVSISYGQSSIMDKVLTRIDNLMLNYTSKRMEML